MPKLTFKPDVTVGDLVVLARLFALHHQDGHANPGEAFREKTDATKDQVRGTMIRLKKALGEIEKDGGWRRSQQPNDIAGNFGAAGVIAELIIDIARAPGTDQKRLLTHLSSVFSQLSNRHAAGEFLPQSDRDRETR